MPQPEAIDATLSTIAMVSAILSSADADAIEALGDFTARLHALLLRGATACAQTPAA
jgi:hypothetical protein